MAGGEELKSPFGGRRIADQEELEVKLAEIDRSPDGPVANFLSDFWFDMQIDPSLDPLSPAYRDAVLLHYHRIAGPDRRAAFDANTNEIVSGDLPVVRPWPYDTGSGEQVGQFLQAIGFILVTCRFRRGHRVLLMGAGSANLALTLAKLGCIVTMIDANRRNVAVLGNRAERASLMLQVVHAEPDNAPGKLGGQVFDFVVFHAAFHRNLNHLEMLQQIRDRLLARGGRLVLAGEPLLEAALLPWGLDPAGGSIWAMRHGSGPSLVFRPSYLLHALAAYGYAPILSVCPQAALGNVIVAVRSDA